MTKEVKPRKQESIIGLLNKSMTLNHPYAYNEIRSMTVPFGFKEGTVTSVLCKAKGAGFIDHHSETGVRTRTGTITYKGIREFDRTNYTQRSNTSGISQKMCDKVAALVATEFKVSQITSILNLSRDVVNDVIDCGYNVRKFNDLFRSRLDAETTEEPKDWVPTLYGEDTKIVANLEALKEAINNTISTLVEWNGKRDVQG